MKAPLHSTTAAPPVPNQNPRTFLIKIEVIRAAMVTPRRALKPPFYNQRRMAICLTAAGSGERFFIARAPRKDRERRQSNRHREPQRARPRDERRSRRRP